MAASRFRVPHTLFLLFAMVVLAQALSYVLPHGSFDRVPATDGSHDVVVAGSFRAVDDPEQLAPWTMFTAIPRGFEAAQGIIFFVFIIGGAFGVFRATGAADALIAELLDKLGHKPLWLVAGGMFVFSLGSATIGMAEEYLPFVPILLALCLALGFDTVTAVGIMCVGYGTGYGDALFNPFTVIIAQEVSGVPPASGMGYRVILLLVFLAIGIDHVWRYARRVKADPTRSLVAGIDPPEAARLPAEPVPFTGRRIGVLVTLALALVLLLWGLVGRGWYLIEMGGLFAAASVAMAAVGGLGVDRAAREFCSGAMELTTTALLIGVARTIEVVLSDGQVIDTIVHAVAQPLQQLGPHAAAVGMLVVQSLCNFFIPSGSGQAYVTMPLMAPLADLVGVTRQTAVLAYQFGDGFTNILVPTNAVLIGILTMAGIPYERWLRFIVPFMLKIWAGAIVALVIAVTIGYA